MYIVLGSIVIKEGKFDEALAASQEHVARSRLEPGCISHDVSRDFDNPSKLVFVERWADRAALAAHFKVPASRGFVKALAGLVAEAPKMEVWDAERIQRSSFEA